MMTKINNQTNLFESNETLKTDFEFFTFKAMETKRTFSRGI